MLGQILKLLKLLNADVNPMQIAAGVSFGMVLGFTPLWSLHNLITLFVICLFRINVSAVLLSFAVFSGLAYLLDPLFIKAGEAILLNQDLQVIWTSLYQEDLWRLAHFNHTLLMGSLAVSVLLFFPCMLISRLIIIQYRERILAWVRKSRLVQTLKASKWAGALFNAAEKTGLTE